MPAIDPYYDSNSPLDTADDADLDQMLYSRHAEIECAQDLMQQRGTPIPALFSHFYKFIQNPSTVSVETFKRMIDTDDTIGSGVDFLTTCLAARLGRYQHESEEVTEFINKALDQIEGGFVPALKELLGATWAGFAVQEKVWSNDNLGFIVKKLVSLPPGTVLFETERTGELTSDGILQYQRNYNPANLAYGSNFMFGFSNTSDRGVFRPDPFAKFGDAPFPIRASNVFNYLSIRIPKVKCIHYAFDAAGKLGNPYGKSLLRRAYKWYVMKDAFLQMLSVALDRKGTPLTIVYADPSVSLADPDKGPIANASTRGSAANSIRADLAAQKAFKNIHNDTTIILPGKKGQVYDTDFVPQSSNASEFIASIDLCNRSILRSMLIPSLIFGNGDGSGSYSLGQEHAKTFDKILDGMLAGLKNTLINQLVKELIAYNFPRSVWEKDGFGDFGKREMSVEEIDKEIEVLDKAVNMGAVDMNDLNDLNAVRDKIGLEPLDHVIAPPVDPMALGPNGEVLDGAETEQDPSANGKEGNLPPQADGGGGKPIPGSNGGNKPGVQRPSLPGNPPKPAAK